MDLAATAEKLNAQDGAAALESLEELDPAIVSRMQFTEAYHVDIAAAALDGMASQLYIGPHSDDVARQLISKVSPSGQLCSTIRNQVAQSFANRRKPVPGAHRCITEAVTLAVGWSDGSRDTLRELCRGMLANPSPQAGLALWMMHDIAQDGNSAASNDISQALLQEALLTVLILATSADHYTAVPAALLAGEWVHAGKVPASKLSHLLQEKPLGRLPLSMDQQEDIQGLDEIRSALQQLISDHQSVSKLITLLRSTELNWLPGLASLACIGTIWPSVINTRAAAMATEQLKAASSQRSNNNTCKATAALTILRSHYCAVQSQGAHNFDHNKELQHIPDMLPPLTNLYLDSRQAGYWFGQKRSIAQAGVQPCSQPAGARAAAEAAEAAPAAQQQQATPAAAAAAAEPAAGESAAAASPAAQGEAPAAAGVGAAATAVNPVPATPYQPGVAAPSAAATAAADATPTTEPPCAGPRTGSRGCSTAQQQQLDAGSGQAKRRRQMDSSTPAEPATELAGSSQDLADSHTSHQQEQQQEQGSTQQQAVQESQGQGQGQQEEQELDEQMQQHAQQVLERLDALACEATELCLVACINCLPACLCRSTPMNSLLQLLGSVASSVCVKQAVVGLMLRLATMNHQHGNHQYKLNHGNGAPINMLAKLVAEDPLGPCSAMAVDTIRLVLTEMPKAGFTEVVQGTNVLRTLCEHVAKEPDHSRQQRIIACIYKMRLASRENIIEAGLFPTVVALLRAQGHPQVPKSPAPKTMGMDVLDAQRLAVSSATVMLVRMLAWQAELAYQHQCLDLVAELLGDDPLMDIIDVEGIRNNVLANVYGHDAKEFMAAMQGQAAEARRPTDLLPLLRVLQQLWLEIKYADEQHAEAIARMLQITADLYLSHKASLSAKMDEELRNGLWALTSCACMYTPQSHVVLQLAQLMRGSDARLQARCAEVLSSWLNFSSLDQQQQEAVFEAATYALQQEGLPFKALEAICSLVKRFSLSAAGKETRWALPFKKAGVVARLADVWRKQLQQGTQPLAQRRAIQQVANCLAMFMGQPAVVAQMHDAGVFELVVQQLRCPEFRRFRLFTLEDEEEDSSDSDDEEERDARSALQRCYVTQHQLLSAMALQYPSLIVQHDAYIHFMQLLLADDLTPHWSASRCDQVTAALLDMVRRAPQVALSPRWRGDLVQMLIRIISYHLGRRNSFSWNVSLGAALKAALVMLKCCRHGGVTLLTQVAGFSMIAALLAVAGPELQMHGDALKAAAVDMPDPDAISLERISAVMHQRRQGLSYQQQEQQQLEQLQQEVEQLQQELARPSGAQRAPPAPRLDHMSRWMCEMQGEAEADQQLAARPGVAGKHTLALEAYCVEVLQDMEQLLDDVDCQLSMEQRKAALEAIIEGQVPQALPAFLAGPSSLRLSIAATQLLSTVLNLTPEQQQQQLRLTAAAVTPVGMMRLLWLMKYGVLSWQGGVDPLCPQFGDDDPHRSAAAKVLAHMLSYSPVANAMFLHCPGVLRDIKQLLAAPDNSLDCSELAAVVTALVQGCPELQLAFLRYPGMLDEVMRSLGWAWEIAEACEMLSDVPALCQMLQALAKGCPEAQLLISSHPSAQLLLGMLVDEWDALSEYAGDVLAVLQEGNAAARDKLAELGRAMPCGPESQRQRAQKQQQQQQQRKRGRGRDGCSDSCETEVEEGEGGGGLGRGPAAKRRRLGPAGALVGAVWSAASGAAAAVRRLCGFQ